MVIYFHNGGKFDFFFFLKYLENPLKIIHGRIVKAKIGIHEFRDSWAIFPMPLAGYAKTKIDYARMEKPVREKHRAEILDYLKDDCTYLFDLVDAFVRRFGFRLTVAGNAQRELRKLHPQFNQGFDHDKTFRPFYFGGRVECFGAGVLTARPGHPFKVYDVNSMYPHVMRECRHPIGRGYVRPARKVLDAEGWIRGFSGKFYFAIVRGRNFGALPQRALDNNGGLDFQAKDGIFHTTSHELRLALSLGKFIVDEIIDAWIPRQTQSFGDFVDTFAAEKIAAKKSRDKVAETIAKLTLNSAYGRFGINPFDFNDYHIQIAGDARPLDDPEKLPWEPYEKNSEFWIWRRPVHDPDDPEGPSHGFEDVAIAASITSAARAVLMLAVAQARRPLYCDTDSLICEEIRNVPIDDTRLGAWKYEGEGDTLALAGKKLYALWDKGECVKSASKGVKLSPEEIRAVALGETINWQNDAPNFSLLGGVRFVNRNVKSTLKGR